MLKNLKNGQNDWLLPNFDEKIEKKALHKDSKIIENFPNSPKTWILPNLVQNKWKLNWSIFQDQIKALNIKISFKCFWGRKSFLNTWLLKPTLSTKNHSDSDIPLLPDLKRVPMSKRALSLISIKHPLRVSRKSKLIKKLWNVLTMNQFSCLPSIRIREASEKSFFLGSHFTRNFDNSFWC